MEEQMDIFDNNKNTDNESDNDMKKQSSPDDNKDDDKGNDKVDDKNDGKQWHTYKITPTKMSLHTIGEKLASRYNWVTNGMVPYAASNVIHVDYNLDYDTIQDLYDQDRIITYQADDTFTTWINKSVKKQKKSPKQK